MPFKKIGLLIMLCFTAAADALAQPAPEFPESELKRGHEGWVMLDYTLAGDGSVSNLTIADSSGNVLFNEAALKVARGWHFDKPEKQPSRVLINFVFDEKKPRLSRKFVTRNAKVHKAIDAGRLGDAAALIEEIRKQKNLNPFELAYSFVAEGRVAEVRGDKVGQLRCFRAAMLSHGRWVTDETYVKLLYGALILELGQKDYASAVRDYDLLAATESGRKLADRLGDHLQIVRQFLGQTGDQLTPYVAASHVIDVERELPRRLGDETYADAGYVWLPSADKADTPPSNR